jgi:hypothetical protein
VAMNSPYREAGWLTAQEARLRSIENRSKMLNAILHRVLAAVEGASANGEFSVVITERIPGELRLRLTGPDFGYKLENCWENGTVTRVYW